MTAARGSEPGPAWRGLDRTTRCRRPVQPPHLIREQHGAAALPAVGEHDGRGSTCGGTSAPCVEDGTRRLARPDAAAPVGDGRRNGGRCRVRIAVRHLAVTRVSRVTIVSTSMRYGSYVLRGTGTVLKAWGKTSRCLPSVVQPRAPRRHRSLGGGPHPDQVRSETRASARHVGPGVRLAEGTLRGSGTN